MAVNVKVLSSNSACPETYEVAIFVYSSAGNKHSNLSIAGRLPSVFGMLVVRGTLPSHFTWESMTIVYTPFLNKFLPQASMNVF